MIGQDGPDLNDAFDDGYEQGAIDVLSEVDPYSRKFLCRKFPTWAAIWGKYEAGRAAKRPPAATRGDNKMPEGRPESDRVAFGPRDESANDYHQSLGAKWMCEHLAAELRTVSPMVAERIEREWTRDWRPKR